MAEEQNFALAVSLQCFAAFLEGLVEPYYYTMLWKGDLSGKVKTEMVALTVKSILTYTLLLRGLNLLAYSLAQLAYAGILVMAYPKLVKVD